MYLTPFHKIIDKYKVIFFDSFGVIKNASGLIPGVESTFDFLNSRSKKSIILTNDSSRSPEKLCAYYHAKGIKSITSADFVSSGMMARQYLGNRAKKGVVAYLGTEASSQYIKELGIKMKNAKDVSMNISDIEDLVAMVFLDDEGFEWRSTLNNVLNILRQTSIPVIVANSDHTYPSDADNLSIAVGSLADMIESISGKRFIRFGKPDAQIFQYAFEHANHNGKLKLSDILMVGDTLTTDIIGAQKFGIDSALVLTGNTIPDQAQFLIQTYGITPTYICESIVV